MASGKYGKYTYCAAETCTTNCSSSKSLFYFSLRYCHLLGSCPPLCPSSDSSPDPRPTSILYFVLQILEVGKAAQPVIQVVLQIVLDLIGSFESGAESEMECVHDDPTWESSVEGLEILRPFIPLVLDYLSGAIKRKQLKQGDVDRNGSIQLEFEVLSRYQRG